MSENGLENRYILVDNCANCENLGYSTKQRVAFCTFFLNRQESDNKHHISIGEVVKKYPIIEKYTDIEIVHIPIWCRRPNPENMKAIDEP